MKYDTKISRFYKNFKESENQKVLLMLSGGKDSSASLHILKKYNIDVTAIHFKHKWGFSLSTDQARKLCKKLEVKLIEVDFTDRFYNKIENFSGGRPCLLCKPEMYKIVIEHLKSGEYGWICIGDNADDRTTIVRLQDYIKETNDNDIYCSTYFGSEQGIELPKHIKVVRPVLDLPSLDVDDYLKINKIEIQKNNSTGDKYFEYSREGCPVQFHDPGYPIKRKTLDKLHRYNLILNKFAREKNIRASIHLPSTFIVTIPTGYEKEAAIYLERNGLEIDYNVNSLISDISESLTVNIYIHNTEIFKSDIYKKLYIRMMERVELKILYTNYSETSSIITTEYGYNDGCLFICYLKKSNFLNINFIGKNIPGKNLISNLIIEIFRSRNFSIYSNEK